MPTYLRVRSYCLVVISVGLCLIDVCNNTALTIHAEATAFIQCSVDFLCRESVSKSVAFARANVVAMSSEEEHIYGGNVPADESTDDEVDGDIVLKAIAVLYPRPCLWVTFAYKLLFLTFFKGPIWICVRADTTLSTQILCLKRRTACAYLDMPLSDSVLTSIKKMKARDDVKIFLKVQAGGFLHRVKPAETFSYRLGPSRVKRRRLSPEEVD